MFRALLVAIGVVVVVSTLPVNPSQPSAFADPAFSRYYARSSAAEQQLLWGGGPLVSLVEPFTGAPGNRRLVQYFERGRMEMADSTAGTSAGAISQGLLVREMATGYVQLGYDDFVQGEPAPIPLFGPSDADALTYADFAVPVATKAADRTGELLDDWIAPGGVISKATPPAEILAGGYEPVTGHNIPHVTASWLKTDPFGIDANDALGLPISEPYWVHSGKGESGISLIQLFERRVVVYTPNLPLAERFSLTSAGRHYYRWRYGNDPGADTADAPAQREVLARADDTAGLSLPDGYQASILSDAADAFGIAVTPNGKLAVGYNDGRIELIDPRDPTAKPTTFVEHLANPAVFTWAGTDLYVVDDSGLHRYHDRDANGVADDDETIIDGSFERASVQLAPGPDATLFLTGRPTGATGTAFAESGAPQLYQIAADALTTTDSAPAALDTTAVNALLVDDSGAVWLIDDNDQLVQYLPETSGERTLLDASQFASVRDVLLYRPDGTSGNPYRDMLALADGRIVRLQPSRPDSASPSAGTGPAAIVDFITGFDRPTAMVSGLDGSLYVLDTGRDVIYQIKPD
ncbi:MAG TPA: hypothetical protein VFV93_08895 [Thermomicrobiales bacterium]|nr:hypothetical protein [Thermomicrobiales bacterium]